MCIIVKEYSVIWEQDIVWPFLLTIKLNTLKPLNMNNMIYSYIVWRIKNYKQGIPDVILCSNKRTPLYIFYFMTLQFIEEKRYKLILY